MRHARLADWDGGGGTRLAGGLEMRKSEMGLDDTIHRATWWKHVKLAKATRTLALSGFALSSSTFES